MSPSRAQLEAQLGAAHAKLGEIMGTALRDVAEMQAELDRHQAAARKLKADADRAYEQLRPQVEALEADITRLEAELAALRADVEQARQAIVRHALGKSDHTHLEH